MIVDVDAVSRSLLESKTDLWRFQSTFPEYEPEGHEEMRCIGSEAQLYSLLLRGTNRERSHQVAGMLEQKVAEIFIFTNRDTHHAHFQKQD